jgi:hypothetical protein
MSGRYDGRIVSSFAEEMVSTPQNYSITCRVVRKVGCTDVMQAFMVVRCNGG